MRLQSRNKLTSEIPGQSRDALPTPNSMDVAFDLPRVWLRPRGSDDVCYSGGSGNSWRPAKV